MRKLGDTWRGLLRSLRAVANLPCVAAAILWRRTALRRTTVIAVSGSVGKTTAKNCLAAILSQVAPTAFSPGRSNGRFGLPQLILSARPHHRYLVAEVGILKPGRMWRSAFLLKPDLVVITSVNWQHARNFVSLDQIAQQKAMLLRPLTARGRAVLNADDPRVARMADGLPCPVTTFGCSASADLQGKVVSHRWPGRLTLEVVHGGESHLLQTQLVGNHWQVSVLAAVAAARSLGVPWPDCSSALAAVQPHPGRMRPVRLPSGAVLLRDEYNGSHACLEKALDVLNQAAADRKILALGHILDAPQLADQAPEQIGRSVVGKADLLLCWGAYRDRYRTGAAGAGMDPECISGFETQKELAAFLQRESRPGDLILLKGYWFDHLTRVVFEQFGSVDCRLNYCEIHSVCDDCPRMGFRADPHTAPELIDELWAGLPLLRP